MNFPWTELV